MGAVLKRWQTSHAGRAFAHYGEQRGNVLAGGLAYLAVFSLFSILFAGCTVLGYVLAGHPDLLRRVLDAVNQSVPGLIDTSSDEGGSQPLKPSQLLGGSLLSWSGLVAFGLALFSGTGWIDALREGVRAMFALPTEAGTILVQRLRDLVGLVTFGLAVLVSATGSVVVSAAAGYLLSLVGLTDSPVGSFVLRVASVALVFVVDALIFLVLMKVLARVPAPGRNLLRAALVGAALIGLLKLFAGVLLRLAQGSNPLVAGAATLVGILVWMYFVCRAVMFTAAWAAVDPAVVAALTSTQADRVLGPSVGPAMTEAPAGRGVPAWAVPRYGVRAGDRVTVAAGAVLGVGVALVARTAVGALGALRDAVRR